MDGEREKFEAWAGKEADPPAFKISGSGKYVYSEVQAAWAAWQARASIPSAQPSEEQNTCKTCDDDGVVYVPQRYEDGTISREVIEEQCPSCTPSEQPSDITEDEAVEIMCRANTDHSPVGSDALVYLSMEDWATGTRTPNWKRHEYEMRMAYRALMAAGVIREV